MKKDRSFGGGDNARQSTSVKQSGSCNLEELRGTIAGLKFPTELKQCAFVCVESCATCNVVNDPFTVAQNPNLKDIRAAIDHIKMMTSASNNQKTFVLESGGFRFSLEALQKMLDMKQLMQIKRDVLQENKWLQELNANFRLPVNNRKEELIEVATQFVSLIQSKSEFQEVSNLRVNTVKELVGNRLISDSFLSWFINKINLDSDSTYCMSYAEEKRSEAWSEQCARKYQYKNATRTVKYIKGIYMVAKPPCSI